MLKAIRCRCRACVGQVDGTLRSGSSKVFVRNVKLKSGLGHFKVMLRVG